MAFKTEIQPKTDFSKNKEVSEKVKIAILISNKGTGSNLQALIEANNEGGIPGIEIGLVLSDRPDALGLKRAKDHNLTYDVIPFQKNEDREFYSGKIAQRLNQEGVGISVMAGWARILTKPYFDVFKGETVNIHPGLLPETDGSPYLFPDGSIAPWNQGLLTENAVANFIGLGWAGSTIHLATLEADSGPILERTLVRVFPEDSAKTLYDRMKPEEHKALIRTLQNPKRVFEIAEHS